VVGCRQAVTRRVCDYIEEHLDEKIRLDGMAALAGLSTDHFARAFPPLSGRAAARVSVAAALGTGGTHAAGDTCSVVGNSLATGFSDQSHLARHFRRWAGMSPSQVRWTEGNSIRST